MNTEIKLSAKEFWKHKFDEYPQSDADKLAVAMMAEYHAQFSNAGNVWVKASERQPPIINECIIKQVAVRYTSAHATENNPYHYSTGFYSIKDNNFVVDYYGKVRAYNLNDVEWLDEKPIAPVKSNDDKNYSKGYKDGFEKGVEFEKNHLKSNDWSTLAKIGTPKEWMGIYCDYLELSTQQDTAQWWQEQFNIANAERNELKKQSNSNAVISVLETPDKNSNAVGDSMESILHNTPDFSYECTAKCDCYEKKINCVVIEKMCEQIKNKLLDEQHIAVGDVEEAAEIYAIQFPNFDDESTELAFKAGAEWQAKQQPINNKVNDVEEDELQNWRDECERLAKVADYWQKEYYKINPGFQRPKIDNL